MEIKATWLKNIEKLLTHWAVVLKLFWNKQAVNQTTQFNVELEEELSIKSEKTLIPDVLVLL